MEENRVAARKRLSGLNDLTLEDVRHLLAMEEENRVVNQRRKLINRDGADKSNGERIQFTPSEKISLKDNLNMNQTSGLKIRYDEYCYICPVCRCTGDFLYCDYCACPYHIECLNPPLQSIPEGKWKCPSCSIGCSSKHEDMESVNHDKMAAAAARHLPLSKKTSTAMKHKSSMKASDAPSARTGWSNKSNTESKYSLAGRASKLKYARLRTRQKERLFRSRKSLIQPSAPQASQLPRFPETRSLQPPPLFAESHTEVLQRFIKAGSALRNQQRAWYEEELNTRPE